MQDILGHPLTSELREIFRGSRPPERVTQRQFDGADADLLRLAKSTWEEMLAADSWWAYLMDMKYVPLQQELFDHVFPALLLRWYQGQIDGRGAPETETDFYSAIDSGSVLTKMLSAERYARVLDWMGRVYIEGVDAWTDPNFVGLRQSGVDTLQGRLSTLNALGQSVPIWEELLVRLGEVKTAGRARFWLVLGTGIVWNENECPWVPAWDPNLGGGGVYVLESEASIFQHGFLPSNLKAAERHLTYAEIGAAVESAGAFLRGTPKGEWYEKLIERFQKEPSRINARLSNLIAWYSKPDLGGVLRQPLDHHPREGTRPWWRF